MWSSWVARPVHPSRRNWHWYPSRARTRARCLRWRTLSTDPFCHMDDTRLLRVLVPDERPDAGVVAPEVLAAFEGDALGGGSRPAVDDLAGGGHAPIVRLGLVRRATDALFS